MSPDGQRHHLLPTNTACCPLMSPAAQRCHSPVDVAYHPRKPPAGRGHRLLPADSSAAHSITCQPRASPAAHKHNLLPVDVARCSRMSSTHGHHLPPTKAACWPRTSLTACRLICSPQTSPPSHRHRLPPADVTHHSQTSSSTTPHSQRTP